jgi:hypothetical protein
MGFYYGPSSPPPEKEPGGCMEVLVLTRAAFGALALPVLILFGSILGIALAIYLFSVHVLLGAGFLILFVLGVALYARWERGRFPGGPPA